MGISGAISGDNDNNAAAALKVDVDGAGFQPAHRLSRTASDRFVGSAFSLPDGKPYQVRVVSVHGLSPSAPRRTVSVLSAWQLENGLSM